MERSTSAWNHIQWNRSMATKRSSARPAAELAPANVAMPPRRHLLQWVKRLVAMEEVVEAEELVPLQTEPEVQWEVVVVRDKRCPPEEEAEVVRATPRSVQTNAAHEEPGAPGAVASMSRTSAYAPGVAHLPSALANY
jgi:hypothetical protein